MHDMSTPLLSPDDGWTFCSLLVPLIPWRKRLSRAQTVLLATLPWLCVIAACSIACVFVRVLALAAHVLVHSCVCLLVCPVVFFCVPLVWPFHRLLCLLAVVPCLTAFVLCLLCLPFSACLLRLLSVRLLASPPSVGFFLLSRSSARALVRSLGWLAACSPVCSFFSPSCVACLLFLFFFPYTFVCFHPDRVGRSLADREW